MCTPSATRPRPRLPVACHHARVPGSHTPLALPTSLPGAGVPHHPPRASRELLPQVSNGGVGTGGHGAVRHAHSCAGRAGGQHVARRCRGVCTPPGAASWRWMSPLPTWMRVSAASWSPLPLSSPACTSSGSAFACKHTRPHQMPPPPPPENSASLADALRSIMQTRQHQASRARARTVRTTRRPPHPRTPLPPGTQENFQLVVITHDETFARCEGNEQRAVWGWVVPGASRIGLPPSSVKFPVFHPRPAGSSARVSTPSTCGA